MRNQALQLKRAFWSKIAKAPRGIQDEKSSKDNASSRNLVSTIGAQASPKKGGGTESGVRKGIALKSPTGPNNFQEA